MAAVHSFFVTLIVVELKAQQRSCGNELVLNQREVKLAMATEQQPAVTVLGRPREPVAPSPTPSDLAGSEPPQPIEFRGFEYFAQRDFNEFKDASRAYFAKNDAPSSWLGDATPPASAHPSLDESRTAPGPASYQSSEKEPKKEKLILGLRRQWFWTVLAIILVVLIVAIGVGVGVSTTRAASSSKSAGVVGPTYVVMSL